ncbi:MAG TPA: Fe-S cluster assembly protein SufD [Gemmatimonadales bacterium]|nr:Fe-S cluster assembly protein SufD [Gemmatimonadales bacterium]
MTAHFVGAYEAFAANGAAGAPPWLKEMRERAIARFAEVGFPTTRLEQWRFTNVQPIRETPFELHRSSWELDPVPAGVTVSTLSATVATAPDFLQAHLGRYANVATSPFTALSTAFLADGIVIRVAARTVVPEPIRVRCVIPRAARPMTHPRLLIVLEREAQAKIVEAYEGDARGVSFTNSVTEVVLEEAAQLDLCREQREGAQSNHVAASHFHQARDSRLVFTTVALGAGLVRHDIHGVLDGANAYLILNGLSVLGGHQHVDHHTTIDHAKPHCESHEYFNGVFDGESHGVFNGRIIVRPGAQRTDSKQTNNNLLLSHAARADSQPQLEIYADDVKCTHGSTVGPLDPTALFYLRSRGLGAEEARGLLTYGFGAEILDRIAVPGARARLDSEIRARLGVPDITLGAA